MPLYNVFLHGHQIAAKLPADNPEHAVYMLRSASASCLGRSEFFYFFPHRDGWQAVCPSILGASLKNFTVEEADPNVPAPRTNTDATPSHQGETQ
jgi:hypothetical protein